MQMNTKQNIRLSLLERAFAQKTDGTILMVLNLNLCL